MATLILVQGPTAVGKTAHAIQLAQQYHTPILSFDSRQFYSELNIGVARPSPEELAAAQHYFIACRSVTNPYNIYQYEQEALALLQQLFQTHPVVIAVGGSGLYADALEHGVSILPDPPAELRQHLQDQPLEVLQQQLLQLDPDYYHKVDLQNKVRIQRALEVSLMMHKPYSQVVQPRQAQRPFDIQRQVVQLPSEQLRERINRRVDLMMQQGLLNEVESVLPYRQINTLNTVGYRELFPIVSGEVSMSQLPDAVQRIKYNTWHYAKKQLTWLRRYATEFSPQIHN